MPAFEQRPLLERIDERHHAAGRDLQPLADSLLGLALPVGDRAQQGELAWLELERRENLAEVLGDRVADRRQHERDPAERNGAADSVGDSPSRPSIPITGS